MSKIGQRCSASDPCEKNNYLGENTVCVNGYCIYESEKCTSSTDCEFGYICSNGECVEIAVPIKQPDSECQRNGGIYNYENQICYSQKDILNYYIADCHNRGGYYSWGRQKCYDNYQDYYTDPDFEQIKEVEDINNTNINDSKSSLGIFFVSLLVAVTIGGVSLYVAKK